MVTQASGEIALEEDNQATALEPSGSTEERNERSIVITTVADQPWPNPAMEEQVSTEEAMEQPMEVPEPVTEPSVDKLAEPKSMEIS